MAAKKKAATKKKSAVKSITINLTEFQERYNACNEAMVWLRSQNRGRKELVLTLEKAQKLAKASGAQSDWFAWFFDVTLAHPTQRKIRHEHIRDRAGFWNDPEKIVEAFMPALLEQGELD